MFKEKFKRTIAVLLLVSMIVTNNSFVVLAENVNSETVAENSKEQSKVYRYYEEYIAEQTGETLDEEESVDADIEIEEEFVEEEIPNEEEKENDEEAEEDNFEEEGTNEVENVDKNEEGNIVEEDINEIEKEEDLINIESEEDLENKENREEQTEKIDEIETEIGTESETETEIESEEPEEDLIKDTIEDTVISTENETEVSIEDETETATSSETEEDLFSEIEKYILENATYSQVEFEKHVHKQCGFGMDQMCEHKRAFANHTEPIMYEEWNEDTEVKEGAYYLTKDIEYGMDINFSGNLYLCLNGHKLFLDDCVFVGLGDVSENNIYIADCAKEYSEICTTSKESMFVNTNLYINNNKEEGLMVFIGELFDSKGTTVNRKAQFKHIDLFPEYAKRKTNRYGTDEETDSLDETEERMKYFVNMPRGELYADGFPYFIPPKNQKIGVIRIFDEEDSDNKDGYYIIAPATERITIKTLSGNGPLITVDRGKVRMSETDFIGNSGDGSLIRILNEGKVEFARPEYVTDTGVYNMEQNSVIGTLINIEKGVIILEEGTQLNIRDNMIRESDTRLAVMRINETKRQRYDDDYNSIQCLGNLVISDNKLVRVTDAEENPAALVIGENAQILTGNTFISVRDNAIIGRASKPFVSATYSEVMASLVETDVEYPSVFGVKSYNSNGFLSQKSDTLFDANSTHMEIVFMNGNHTGTVFNGWNSSTVLNYTESVAKIAFVPNLIYNERFTTYVDGAGEDAKVKIGVEPENLVYYIDYNKGVPARASDGNNYSARIQGTKTRKRVQGYNTLVSLESEYTLEGYKQLGWASVSGATTYDYACEEEVMQLATEDEQVITLYAVWTEVQYRVNFVNAFSVSEEGARIEETNGRDVYYYSTLYFSDYNISRTGYQINAWILNSVEGQKEGSETIATGSEYPVNYQMKKFTQQHNLTFNFYPKAYYNSYTINYNANVPRRANGQAYSYEGSMESQKMYYTFPEMLSYNQFLVKGFSFVGWSRVARGIIRNETEEQIKNLINYENSEVVWNITSTDGATINLYAVWAENKYSIVFEKGDNSANIPPVTFENVFYSDTITAPNGVFTKTDFITRGYRLRAAMYYVTSGSEVEEELLDEEEIAELGLKFYTMEEGGYYTEILDDLYSEDQMVLFYSAIYDSGSMRVYYHSNAPKDINGEQYVSQVADYVVDMNLLEYEYAEPNRFYFTGYNFLGWGESTSSTVVKFEEEDSLMSSVPDETGSLHLYALWQAITYNVTYIKGNPNATNRTTALTQTNLSYNTKYNTKTSIFSYTGHTISYYVIDSITYGGNSVEDAYLPKDKYSQGAQFYNLTTISNATVTLRAVWTEVPYKIVFDANAPEGIEATGNTTEMNFTGPETRPLSPNGFIVKGYGFEGWSKDPAATVPTYEDGESVYGLGTYENEVITLYAIWGTLRGTIEFIPGFNPRVNDVMAPLIVDSDDVLVPEPYTSFTTNASGDPFIFYNIASMRDAEGNEIELTDDEKLQKVYPGDQASYLLRGNGYTTVLQKIYDTQYFIVYGTDSKTDTDGIIHEILIDDESEETQIVRMNERVKIKEPTSYRITNGGFELTHVFVDDRGNQYTDGQIVENIVVNPYGEILLTPQYKAITYNIEFTKGGPESSIRNTMNPITNKEYDEPYTFQSRYSWTGHTVEYYVLEKVTLADGTVLDKDQYTRERIMRNEGSVLFGYKNLTTWSNATVTLRAVWTSNDYKIRFNPNVPRGYVLAENIGIYTQDVSGGDTVNLTPNRYKINALQFVGWAKDASSEQVDYTDGKEVFAINDGIQEYVDLYALWRRKSGTIKFLPGYESTDVMPDINVMETAEIPEPNQDRNNAGAYFRYYIIATITNAEGNIYSEGLTEEEKLKKVYPGDESVALLRADGDTVTLIKIYNDEYYISLYGGYIDDSEGNRHVAEPQEYNQVAYINDRVILGSPSSVGDVLYEGEPTFTISGYNFINTYHNISDETDTKVYKYGELLDCLAEYAYEEVLLQADFAPINYYIRYNKSNQRATGTMRDDIVAFDEEKTLKATTYNLSGNTLEYWVFDSIIVKGTETKNPNNKRERFGGVYPNSVKNLSEIGESYAVLKAVWSNVTYYIDYDPNLPTGYTLTSNETIDRLTLVGGEEGVITDRVYEAKGLEFLGWSRNKNAKQAEFVVGDVIYGLADNTNQIITMYAVWSKKAGNVEFDPGHNSDEEIPKIEIKETDEEDDGDRLIPTPSETKNDTNDDFVYYIIRDIVDVSGNPYELTDEEKLLKIYPKDNIPASSLIINEGDTVTLLKIYKEPYKVILLGDEKTDLDGKVYKATPAQYVQEIYVNDRQRLASVSFAMDGAYTFNRTFTDDGYVVYSTNQIVEKLAENKGDEVTFLANYDPIKYTLRFIPGNEGVTNPTAMPDIPNRNYDTVYNFEASDYYSFGTHNIEYFIIDKITKPNGEEVDKASYEKKKVYTTGRYYNLTDINNAIVTLKAVWSDINYYISFDPNVPEGYVLSEDSTPMATQSFVGGETRQLLENTYRVPGLRFAGWNTDANADRILYADRENVSALAERDGEIIQLFAIWGKLSGYMHFNPGHNSNEEIPSIEISSISNTLVPRPTNYYNNTGDAFLYYIIESMTDKDGNPYELTDEEKLLKIDPDEGVNASSLLRNDGDHITLIKIYDEPYTVLISGNEIANLDGGTFKGTPSELRQTIYVNDRERLNADGLDINFEMTGFKFNNTYLGSDNVSYTTNQIVEKLCNDKNKTYTVKAQYDPIKYTITFDKGNPRVTISGEQSDTGIKYFNTQYNLPQTRYRYTEGGTIDYYVVDKITLEDGSTLPQEQVNRRKIYRDPGTYQNLTIYDNSQVTLKAVWSAVEYKINFLPNVPEGRTLKEEKMMPQQTVTGGVDATLTLNTYEVQGYQFAGWNLIPATTSVLYEDGATIYGLATKDNDIINLYAIWEKLGGTIDFDPGHDPIPGDNTDPIDTGKEEDDDEEEGDDTRIPSPSEPYDYNDDGRPFLYYIIKDIKDKTGKELELTEEELLRKVYPGEEASTLLRNNGDTVTLLKIYDEPYSLIHLGNEKKDSSGNIYYGSPSEYIQTIYVNDRQRIATVGFALEKAFKFNNTYIGDDKKEYKTGQIVEKLCAAQGASFAIGAQYEPITYKIVFDKGNPKATGVMDPITDIPYDEEKRLTANKYSYAGHVFEYFVLDKITLADGTELKKGEFERKKFLESREKYKNLTIYDGATVTLKAVWRDVDYYIYFEPNVPEGLELEENITMPPQKISGGEEVALNENKYSVKQYKFLGWNMDPATTSILYKDKEVVYGLATKDNDAIELYAVWGKKNGKVKIDPGYNPKPGDEEITIDTEEDEDTLLPTPVAPYNSNADEDPFLYYIIKDAVDADGNEIELTDEEKLMKIDPTEGVDCRDILKDDGSTVTLIKIYEAPYTVRINGSSVTDYDGTIRYGSPSEITQEIYVNDRERLEVAEFTLDGYIYNHTYTGEDGNIYVANATKSQIVERLRENRDEEFNMAANYDPIKYTIEYAKGNPRVTGTMKETENVPYNATGRTLRGISSANANYTYAGHTFEKWVLETIKKPDGTVIKVPNDQRLVFRDRAAFYNLTNIDGAVVTLKAIWSDIKYYVAFYPNLPTGHSLDSSEQTMARQEFVGAEEKALTKNVFTSKGLSFDGWALSSSSREVYFRDEDIVCGLGNKDNDVISIYGVWHEKKGTIVFDPGHLPKPGDTTPNIDTGLNPNATIPEPKDEFKTNANDDDFKYYIIDTIVASNGEAYELTDDEKLLKIEPSKGDVLANSFIKNDGDVVTLIKIYDEPYKVVMHGSSETDGEGVVHYGSPSQVIQYIDVNDRQRLTNPMFTMSGGYVFLKTFRDEEENVYNVNQIVEKLCETKLEEFDLYANYDPIHYNVDFLPGNSLVSNPNAMAKVENIRYDEERPVNNLYEYAGHTVEYFVVEKVTLEDGTVIPAIHESERKKVFDTYVGLTDNKNATVTLKAVWTDVTYYIDFYPNLPDGFELSSPGYIMPRQTFVGGQTSNLSKNEYKAKGLDFLGWNTNYSAKEILYSDEEVVYGLSTRDDEVISLFAVWSKKSGNIEVNPGHNSTEEIPSINVQSDDDKIPEPEKKQNDDGRPFLYYIIEKIADKDGNLYDLTDDEKLLKIDPSEEDVRAATLLKNAGDTVTLLKIYDEPYTVKIQGGGMTDVDGNYIKGSPSEVTQTIYVNDRERLDSPEFSVEGYDFAGTYLGQNRVTYTGNQIVEKLAPNMNDTFVMTAQYDAIKYYIEFDPGNPGVTNPNAMSKEVLGEAALTFTYNTPKQIPGNTYSYGAKRMLEFVVDKVTKENGEELGPHEFTRLRIQPKSMVSNLTDQKNATVTLKAVWQDVEYRVIFEPNVPEGESLENPDLEIAPITFVGNESHALNETIVNNEYWKIEGYVIKGWNTVAATTSILYEKDERVYDLATRDDDEIVLYAIWEKLSGDIEFDPGHNSDEKIEKQKTDEPVPTPGEMANDTDDAFLYYIIKSIKDAEGNPYEMTDDELLAKIYPGDNIKGYVRENDDVITLLKIYNEPYTVYLTGEDFTVDGIKYTVAPEYYTQEIYVNDRERLDEVSFNVDSGFKFNKTFKDDLNVITSCSQIVEKLRGNKGEVYYTFAQFSPITYKIEFNPGNEVVLNPNGMAMITDREFNKEYTLGSNGYRKRNHTFAYFVLDKVTLADGRETKYTHEKDRVIVNENGTYKNLAKNQDAVATLKAVWNGSDANYRIRFNPNVPSGYVLDETSVAMEALTIQGGEKVPLTKNTYKISGLTFLGWNTIPATTSIAFNDEETVYGLATRDNDVIDLYAIWVKKGGTIEYNPGHLSSEVISPTKTDGSDGGDGLVAIPAELTNSEGDEFLYYIIEKIVDKDGRQYDLTDEEKLRKIHPEEGVAGGSLIRNDGDTVTLIKIYNEPYDVTVNGNPPAVPESIEGTNVTSPLSYTQQIYVNDRERLEIPTFSLAGYEFVAVRGVDGRTYTRNQIVEKLKDYKGDEFVMNANWVAIKYNVVFDKNSTTAEGVMEPILNRVYNVPYTFTNQYTNSGYGINYFRVEKITLQDGTEIGPRDSRFPTIATIGMIRSNVYRYYNLSPYDKSTVSVIPIWSRKNMDVNYDNGHNGEGNIEDDDPTKAADPSGQIYNTEGKDFKYWIIASIADASGREPVEVELTDDQKLMKIYPGDSLTGITDIEDASITLMAIYDEPYKVIMNGNPPESPVGGENVASPSVVEMEIDVNDRKRLEVKIEVSGYQMDGLSTTSEGTVIYRGNEIVEKLCEEEGDEFLLYAQWAPNTYNVVFEAGNSSITGSMEAMNNLLFDTAYEVPSSSYAYTGFDFKDWKVSKIVNSDGASVEVGEKIIKYEDRVFYNLTTLNGGTVTLTPEWTGTEYVVTLDSQGRGKTSSGATTYTVTLRHGEPYTLSGSMFTPNSSNTYIGSYNTQTNGKGTAYSLTNYPTGLTTGNSITLYAIWQRESSGNGGNNSGTGGTNSVSGNVSTGNANSSPNTGLLTDTTVYKKGSWIYRDSIDKWQYAANVDNIFTQNNDFFNNGNMYNKQNYEFEADESVVYLADGFYQIGWNDQEHIFEFDKNGFMKTGFTEDKGNIYYLLNTTLNKGALAKGPVNIGGKIYNFDQNGILQKEQESVRSEAGGTWIYEPTVDKWRYQTNAHGSQTAEFLTGDIYRIYGQTDENYFMFDGQGYMMTGEVTYKGETYYLEESGVNEGALVYNKEVNNNVSYLFNQQGKLVAQVKNNPTQQTTGWVQNVTTDGWQYLENNAQGIALPLSNTYRRLESNGAYYDYIFGSNGNMQTGFTEFNGKMYYLEEEGAKIGAVNTENKIINGNTYTFNSDGTLATVNGIVYNYGLPLPK